MNTNIIEFKDLIKRYESITLEELTNPKLRLLGSRAIMNYLTGFGDYETCTLCVKAEELSIEVYGNIFATCNFCIWTTTDNFCYYGKNEQTYSAIWEARNREKLFEAVKKRAEHMKKVLQEYKRM